jgi:Bacterial Ig-like domain (group 1)/Invasin, domain 3
MGVAFLGYQSTAHSLAAECHPTMDRLGSRSRAIEISEADVTLETNPVPSACKRRIVRTKGLIAPLAMSMAALLACGGAPAGGTRNSADAARSTLTAAPSSLAADGIASATLAVVARDVSGSALPGRTVSFAVSGSGNALSAVRPVTDAEGRASVTLTSTRAEAKSVTATLDQVELAPAAVTFVVGAPSALSSSLLASPTTALANGTAIKLTVTVRDATGNPVGGALVTLASNLPSTIAQPPPTDATGVAIGSISATTVQQATVTATFGTTVLATASVDFVTGITGGGGATLFATGMTAPQSGLILEGTTINPATGRPFRHLWYGDFTYGLCRLDPDVDSPGLHTVNSRTCMHFVFGAQFKPGELAFDPGPSTVVPGSNDIYAVDIHANTQGIFRLHYLPGGDSGHGVLDLVHQEILGGNPASSAGLPGCGIPGKVPNSAALGPDGALYVGFKRAGDIVKITSPQTEPLPCGNVSTVAFTGDQQKSFGLGWIGHDMYSGDGFSPFVIHNADQCTAVAPCHGASILAGRVPVPSAVISDQAYPTLTGQNVYFANPNTVTKIVLPSQQVATVGSGFAFVSGLIVDPADKAKLYVGDDLTNGFNVGQGRWWTIP